MQEKEQNNLSQEKDRHLDIPGEANQDKHINFLDAEDTGNQHQSSNRKDEVIEERQKQWKEGLEEGKRARNNE